MEPKTVSLCVSRLLDLGALLRKRIVRALQFCLADPTQPVDANPDDPDQLFQIDLDAEEVIDAAIASWPTELKPLQVVAEGFPDGGKLYGSGSPRHILLVDPIDGTRNIMYDKRPAYFIASVFEAEARTVADAIVSVIVEIPTTKHRWADSFVATRGQPARAFRSEVPEGATFELKLRPSRAQTLLNGFAQVTNFFPGTKVLASELMERIIEETVGKVEPGTAKVFDDQYITTAGQMVELMVGHDRFCCDLRPLFYEILDAPQGLVCHPYDVAGLLVAQQAGVIITDGYSKPLAPPIDVRTPVHWCGYSNSGLRREIEPVIQCWLDEHGVPPGPVRS